MYLFITESAGAPEQMDVSSQQKPSSDESDGQHDGKMQRKKVSLFKSWSEYLTVYASGNILETPASSEKQYRAALWASLQISF